MSPPHQPRPTNAFQAKRFNDRLGIDISYVKDVDGGTHMFLNCVDDGTCYQIPSRLLERTEDAVLKNLLNGWVCFFGAPDELVLDAEGAFRGYRFESLVVQMGVFVRCVPPDAHYQLGCTDALRGGGEPVRAMAAHAKNTLIRRSGSSPAQWVHGRQPKLPASLLSDGGSIETCSLTSDSERLQQIDELRPCAIITESFRARTVTGDGKGSAEGYRQGIVLALDRDLQLRPRAFRHSDRPVPASDQRVLQQLKDSAPAAATGTGRPHQARRGGQPWQRLHQARRGGRPWQERGRRAFCASTGDSCGS